MNHNESIDFLISSLQKQEKINDTLDFRIGIHQKNSETFHMKIHERVRKLNNKVDYLTVWVITLTILLLYFQFI